LIDIRADQDVAEQHQGSVLDSEEGIRFRGKTVSDKAAENLRWARLAHKIGPDPRMPEAPAKSSRWTGASARRLGKLFSC